MARELSTPPCANSRISPQPPSGRLHPPARRLGRTHRQKRPYPVYMPTLPNRKNRRFRPGRLVNSSASPTETRTDLPAAIRKVSNFGTSADKQTRTCAGPPALPPSGQSELTPRTEQHNPQARTSSVYAASEDSPDFSNSVLDTRLVEPTYYHQLDQRLFRGHYPYLVLLTGPLEACTQTPGVAYEPSLRFVLTAAHPRTVEATVSGD